MSQTNIKIKRFLCVASFIFTEAKTSREKYNIYK